MERLLTELKASAQPLSGEKLSGGLGVSRSALWKQVEELRRLGYRIEGAPRVGYRLVESPDRPYPWEVRHGLGGRRLGRKVQYVETVGSTQDEARRLADAGAPEGTLVVAEEQRAARGRLGRSYFTPAGGLWFSLVLRPRRSPEEVVLLSLLTGVAVHRAIEATTGLAPVIKWPNDLLLGDRKLAGILIEMASEQDVLHYVVAGVGVNVNLARADFPMELQPIATSLSEALGRKVARVPLLQRILERMEDLYDRYLAEGGRVALDAWRALPSTLGRRVVVEELQERWEGVAVDLDEEGRLLVRDDDGAVHRVLAGDTRVVSEPPMGSDGGEDDRP